MLPELAGIGATPAARASLAARGEALGAGDLADELGGDQRPEPRLARAAAARSASTSSVISRSSRLDRVRELAQAAQLVARDPDAHRLLGAGQAPADPRAPLLREQRAARQPQLGPEVVQVPEQRAVELDAMADEAFAVVDEQAQVELGPVQVRGRERVQAFLQRGAGDVERVDRIRLAALAGAAARAGAQVRRDPQHALAAPDQKALQRPGDVPAVLKRPDPLAVKAARPPQQGIEPAPADRDRLLAHAARRSPRRRRRSCANACECPRRARSCSRPPLPRQRRTAGGHGLLEAVPRIYQVTPDIPDRRRATKQNGSQALARPTASKRVSSPPVGTFSTASDVTDGRNPNSKPRSDTHAWPAAGTTVVGPAAPAPGCARSCLPG